MRRVGGPPLGKSHSSAAIAAPSSVQSPSIIIVYPHKIPTKLVFHSRSMPKFPVNKPIIIIYPYITFLGYRHCARIPTVPGGRTLGFVGPGAGENINTSCNRRQNTGELLQTPRVRRLNATLHEGGVQTNPKFGLPRLISRTVLTP